MADDKHVGFRKREIHFGISTRTNLIVNSNDVVLDTGDLSNQQTNDVTACWSIGCHLETANYVNAPMSIRCFLQYRLIGGDLWADIEGTEKDVPTDEGSVLLRSLVEGNLPRGVIELRLAFKDGTFGGGSKSFEIVSSRTFIIVRKRIR